MATPLVFYAAGFQQRLYSIIPYPHMISFNRQTNYWIFETNKWKTLPFNIVVVLLVFILAFGLCLLQFLKYILGHSNAVSGFIAVVLLAGAFVSVFCWGTVVVFFLYGSDVIKYINTLFHFENDGKRLCCVYGLDGGSSWREKYELVRSFAYDQGKLDTLGIALNIIVIYSLIVGLTFPIFCHFFKMDPFYWTMEQFFVWAEIGSIHSFNFVYRILIFVVRFILLYLIILEICRSISCFVILALAHCQQYARILKNIIKRPLSMEAIKRYCCLRVLLNFGGEITQLTLVVMLGTGFLIALMFNCFTFVGWKVFPISTYMAGAPMTFFTYFGLHIGLSLTMQAYEISTYILGYHWPNKLTQLAAAIFALSQWKPSKRQILLLRGFHGSSNVNLKEIRKILKAQMTITFRPGKMASLNKEARMTFYSHITTETLSVLLVFTTAMSHGFQIVQYDSMAL